MVKDTGFPDIFNSSDSKYGYITKGILLPAWIPRGLIPIYILSLPASVSASAIKPFLPLYGAFI